VQTIMESPELSSDWDAELKEIRDRINSLRALLVARLQSAGVDRDFSFIEQEKGMFSFLGVNKDQIQTLIQQYSIYLVGSSRINIASINDDNIDYLVESIKAVL